MTLSEDLEAVRKGLCDKLDRAACLEEVGEAGLEWQCANCPKKTWADLSLYTHKILKLRQLQQAGYPFEANDLELEEWEDLGRANAWLATPVL